MRSMARNVLPVLVGPNTAITPPLGVPPSEAAKKPLMRDRASKPGSGGDVAVLAQIGGRVVPRIAPAAADIVLQAPLHRREGVAQGDLDILVPLQSRRVLRVAPDHQFV